uniref:Alpha 1,4-glycosyltransferase domain-containing protein n=1 Tax=Latimeria chalumnae TaxID=7897 RepID=H2ZUI7_LATCH
AMRREYQFGVFCLIVISYYCFQRQFAPNNCPPTQPKGSQTVIPTQPKGNVESTRLQHNIFFFEVTDNPTPSEIAVCAIESAARTYPKRRVAFYMKAYSLLKNGHAALSPIHTIAKAYKNIDIQPLDFSRLFEGTPLFSWYKKTSNACSTFWKHVLADGTRLAMVWKHGGMYLDTDVITLRPVQLATANFSVVESEHHINNAVFDFSLHHEFMWECMQDFVENYNAEDWGQQGPHLFTRMLEKRCLHPSFTHLYKDGRCGNISLFQPKRFYPIKYSDWELFYEAIDPAPSFHESYGVHLWSFMNKSKKKVVVGSNSLLEQLFKKYCPTTHAELKNRNFTEFL